MGKPFVNFWRGAPGEGEALPHSPLEIQMGCVSPPSLCVFIIPSLPVSVRFGVCVSSIGFASCRLSCRLAGLHLPRVHARLHVRAGACMCEVTSTCVTGVPMPGSLHICALAWVCFGACVCAYMCVRAIVSLMYACACEYVCVYGCGASRFMKIANELVSRSSSCCSAWNLLSSSYCST
jgi:hypothetical protein